MKKKYVITGIAVLLFLTAGICYSCSYRKSDADTVLLTENSDNTDEASGEVSPEPDVSQTSILQAVISPEPVVYAHICGAVAHPGVYELKDGGRLIDLVEAAGGFTDNAAQDYINQAQAVADGQRIYIPTEEEISDLSPAELIEGDKSGSQGQSGNGLININTADQEELMSLPGIGESKAAGILSYRKTNGDFKSIEELMNIPGIKEGLFNQISSYITVD